ncbi:hypothetical protein MA16_Dca024939 [Dendrobium catenatum]|uniref:Uncharacterized protein n=1 Tax=Dendrobium catenatum TaxID=906689 RepID=A0A2I0VJ67_9ASPA|nr:hypothetical protein MA16_Dca024939 [Dendrobium catenatum]
MDTYCPRGRVMPLVREERRRGRYKDLDPKGGPIYRKRGVGKKCWVPRHQPLHPAYALHITNPSYVSLPHHRFILHGTATSSTIVPVMATSPTT